MNRTYIRRGRGGAIADHVEPADWHALLAGAAAGLICGGVPSLIVVILRWLA